MSMASIAAILFVMVLSIALPLGIMLFLRKRGGRWFPFLVGAVTFPLFALGLEQSVHAMVLRSSLGEVISGNIWLYALYGGLAAGIFEELGRFAAFKLALREPARRLASLCYGAGHGGIEALLLTGVTMANNLMLALTVNRGGTLPPEVQDAAAQLAEVRLDTPPKSVLGRTTVDAIQIGSIYGTASMIDGMIARFADELGAVPEVLLSGSAVPLVQPYLRTKARWEPELVLRGLALIWRRNQR